MGEMRGSMVGTSEGRGTVELSMLDTRWQPSLRTILTLISCADIFA